MNKLFKLFLVSFISIITLSCNMDKTNITVRITGIENIQGADYEVGAFAYNNLNEGILAGSAGIITSTITDDKLRVVSESKTYDPNAEYRDFVKGEEVYIGARIIYNGTCYETENLEKIEVQPNEIVYISFSKMIEKDSRPK